MNETTGIGALVVLWSAHLRTKSSYGTIACPLLDHGTESAKKPWLFNLIHGLTNETELFRRTLNDDTEDTSRRTESG
jgi:hypothetical protein